MDRSLPTISLQTISSTRTIDAPELGGAAAMPISIRLWKKGDPLPNNGGWAVRLIGARDPNARESAAKTSPNAEPRGETSESDNSSTGTDEDARA